MKQRSMRAVLVVLAVLLALPAFAGTIQIRQSNGTLTDLGGTGAVADMNMATLLACEDQTNNLCMTSGGAVRGTEGNLINSAVGDATSAAFTLPTGSKSFTARITGAGSVVQTLKIYGGTSSGMVAATSELLATINLAGTSGAAGTAAMTPPITAAVLYYIVVTSASSGTPTTILTANY